jgi:hypothetical protein
MAQHDHRRRAGRVVLGAERTPEERTGAEHREVVARDERAAEAGHLLVAAGRAVRTRGGRRVRGAVDAEAHGLRGGALVAEEGDARECPRLPGERAPLVEAERPVVHPAVGRATGQDHEPLLIGHGEPPEEQRLGDGEDRRREPDAEREGQDGGPREARRAAQGACAEAKVLEERRHAGPRSGLGEPGAYDPRAG